MPREPGSWGKTTQMSRSKGFREGSATNQAPGNAASRTDATLCATASVPSRRLGALSDALAPSERLSGGVGQRVRRRLLRIPPLPALGEPLPLGGIDVGLAVCA